MNNYVTHLKKFKKLFLITFYSIIFNFYLWSITIKGKI